MRRTMTWAAALFLFLLGGAAGAAAKGRVWPASEIQFKPGARPGSSRAVLWGDPDKGAYGALIKLSAGTDLGWHTHSNAVRTVIVSGTFVTESQGAPAQELGPGSFLERTAKEKHRTACKEGADCLFFVDQPGKHDFRPEKMAGNP